MHRGNGKEAMKNGSYIYRTKECSGPNGMGKCKGGNLEISKVGRGALSFLGDANGTRRQGSKVGWPRVFMYLYMRTRETCLPIYWAMQDVAAAAVVPCYQPWLHSKNQN